jgi:hypothetical protein
MGTCATPGPLNDAVSQPTGIPAVGQRRAGILRVRVQLPSEQKPAGV